MPANTPAPINLISQEAEENTTLGRIVTWAVTYGRYIMIGTEIVVLLAFISRFSLDRKLTDLNDDVTQKQAIIEANISFERDIRLLQDILAKVKKLVNVSTIPTEGLTIVQSILPPDVYLNSLDVTEGKITAHVVAGTTRGFAEVTSRLQSSPNLANVDIGSVQRKPLEGITFEFTADIQRTPAQ